MLAIRLPEELETRLDKLAAKTGRTKTYYAREVISEYLDDLEDYYLTEARTRDPIGQMPARNRRALREGLFGQL